MCFSSHALGNYIESVPTFASTVRNYKPITDVSNWETHALPLRKPGNHLRCACNRAMHGSLLDKNIVYEQMLSFIGPVWIRKKRFYDSSVQCGDNATRFKF